LDVDIYDDHGNPAKEGYLVIKKPWPGITKGLLNDDQRYIDTYWSKFPNVWYHGDRVTLDDEYMWYIAGRVDDIIKISGHRVDPGEIEQVVTSFHEVVEAAAVGIPDEITGESIYVYCVLRNKTVLEPELSNIRENIQTLLISEIGKFLLPKSINFVLELPKNRAGKILRRLIRQRIMNEKISDSDLLLVENPESLKKI
jgi:acetyl-CoA synthetase